jgi:hypothetical protein
MAVGLAGYLKTIHDGLDGLYRIDRTPDDKLSAYELELKRKRAAELKRLNDRFGPEWDLVFGKKEL